jgi:MoaA/NifB/PqqE/SkfB family radical SAM enzyme
MDIIKNIERIDIEPTNSCNFNCCFCPHDKLKRKIGVMDLSLFKKIIDEIKGWNLRYLAICGFGEPLLDPNIIKKVEYARKNMKKECRVGFNTNALLLSKEKFVSLIKAGLDELRISSYATTPESFMKLHGSKDFETVKSNIISLKKVRESVGASNPMIGMGLLMPPESTENKEEWYKYWNKYFDRFYDETGEVHNFAGGLDYKRVYKGKPRLSCERPLSCIMILWNGDVSICCADYEGKAVYGNVKEKTIKEVIMSPAYQKMLEIHKKRRFELLPICDNCDQLLPATLRNRIGRFKCKFIERRYIGG